MRLSRRFLSALSLITLTALTGELTQLEQRVNDAVEKGKNYLLGLADGKGHFTGEFQDKIGSTALVVCALRKCGVPREHEAIKKAVDRIYEYADTRLEGDQKEVYDCGICLLALDAISQSDDHDYGPTVDTKTKAAAAKLAMALYNSRGNRGGWWYFGKTDGDMSCSQYGALGLWAAVRLGVPIPQQVWDSIAMYVMKVHQKGDGGFSYHDQIKTAEKSTHTITAASIGTLALALRQSTKKEMVRQVVIDDYDKDKKVEKKTIEVESKKPQTEVEKAIEKGFTWWKGNGYDQKNAYYWYAAERACTLTGTKLLGKDPWFDVLAEQILKEQKPDGTWIAGRDATCDTSWALLALTRATGQMIKKDNYDYTGKSSKAVVKDTPKVEAAAAKPPAEKKPEKAATEKKPEKPADE